jgi:hypothetical protein
MAVRSHGPEQDVALGIPLSLTLARNDNIRIITCQVFITAHPKPCGGEVGLARAEHALPLRMIKIF